MKYLDFPTGSRKIYAIFSRSHMLTWDNDVTDCSYMSIAWLIFTAIFREKKSNRKNICIEKICSNNIFRKYVLQYRSKKFQRIQKSYLENRATTFGTRTPGKPQKSIFWLICHDPGLYQPSFVNRLCSPAQQKYFCVDTKHFHSLSELVIEKMYRDPLCENPPSPNFVETPTHAL